MKHFFKKILVLALAVSLPSFAWAETPALRARGLQARSVEDLARLQESEMDLATAILIISKQVSEDLYGQAMDLEAYRQVVDSIARDVHFKKKDSPQKMIQTINRAIYQKWGFSTPRKEGGGAKDHLLNFVIMRREGMCLGLSMLYMSVAERVGVPLYGVIVPGHIFLQYQDSKGTLDIESTARGYVAGEQYFIQMISTKQNGFFCMQRYAKREVVGVYLKNMAIYYFEAGKPLKAVEALEQALMMNANNYEVHGFLGVIYLRLDRPSEAVDPLRNSLEINANQPEIREALALAYYRQALFADAAEVYGEICSENPSSSMLGNWGIALERSGNREGALEKYRLAVGKNPANQNAVDGIARLTGKSRPYGGRFSESFDDPASWGRGLRARVDAPVLTVIRRARFSDSTGVERSRSVSNPPGTDKPGL